MHSLSSVMMEYWFLAFALSITISLLLFLKRKKGFKMLANITLLMLGCILSVIAGMIALLSGLNYFFPRVVKPEISIKHVEILIGHTEADIWILAILFLVGCALVAVARE